MRELLFLSILILWFLLAEIWKTGVKLGAMLLLLGIFTFLAGILLSF